MLLCILVPKNVTFYILKLITKSFIYFRYVQDIQTLLDTLSVKTNSKDLQCTNLLMEFICLLLSLKVTNLEVLYTKVVVCGLIWVDVETTSSKALDLLHTILVQCRSIDSQSQTYKDVILQIHEKLQVSSVIWFLCNDI